MVVISQNRGQSPNIRFAPTKCWRVPLVLISCLWIPLAGCSPLARLNTDTANDLAAIEEFERPRVYPRTATPSAPQPRPASPNMISNEAVPTPAEPVRVARLGTPPARLPAIDTEIKLDSASLPVEAIPPTDALSDNSDKVSPATVQTVGLEVPAELDPAAALGAKAVTVESPFAAHTTEATKELEAKPLAEITKVESVSPSDKAAKKTEIEAATYASGDWKKTHTQTIEGLQAEIRLARSDASRASEVPYLETLLRLHYALAGKREEAAAAIEELSSAEREFWRNQNLGLIDLLGPDRLASESRRYAVALKSLEEAEAQLAAAGSLVLRSLALCRKVQDFGVVERFERYEFTPNQEVLLYVEVRNFAAERKDSATYETELQGSFRVLDRSGAARAERTLPLDKQSSANQRRDYYIAYRLYIPSELAPGAYTLELTIEDKKGNKSNNALIDIRVK